MRIKSYFADSVQEAIDKARVELGPDAMLMNSKSTEVELRALGSVEVVFGLPGETATLKPRLQPGASAIGRIAADSGVTPDETGIERGRATAGIAPSGELAQELAELRHQIETVKRSLIRQNRSTPTSSETTSRIFENICSRLLAAHISEDLAQEIAEATELAAFSWNRPNTARSMREFEMVPSEVVELALSAELDRRLRVAPELGVAGKKRKIVLFAGPPGAGKTTSLIKTGLRFGLQTRVATHILSLDTLRIGGCEQLAAYARIAGLGFDPAHNLGSLDALLNRYEDMSLILIDTPGFGPAETEDLNELATWAKRFGSLDIHLVIPAVLRQSVLRRILDRFKPLSPAKILITHADEIEAAGVLTDLAIRSGLPLSYVASGPGIPEDLFQPSKAEMLKPIVNRKMNAKEDAA